ncbi:techylectin-5A [Nephila pilipes]|uniref:Techylectin-5A n=1 Tax=Nephila pilipes TaxID=299642 RepID=A0A8X6QRD1_NEPPI|nr:techylectin-5A [Nephila pilipes]
MVFLRFILNYTCNSFLFISLIILQVCGKVTSNCDASAKSISFLDVAVDMITMAKINFPVCPATSPSKLFRPVDCEEVLRSGHNHSGVYTIWPRNRVTDDRPIDVFCDMDTDDGGWTVIQRRGNFNRPKDYFYKDWNSYKNGFGDVEEDFWLGNDNIFALTSQRLYSVRFDLQSVNGEKRYALYDTFWIDDESTNYILHATEYSGDAGDSILGHHNSQKFTTKDRDNDNQKDQNCAISYKGGWWYNACHYSNLNGLYLRGPHESYADGVNWHSWRGYKESLDTTEIKIRPKHFRKKLIFNDIQ